MEEAELGPLRELFRRFGAYFGSQPRQVDVEKDVEADREDGNFISSTGAPESDLGPRPEMILVLDSPSLSGQLPSPRVTSDGHQPPESSSDKMCAPPQVPRADGTQYDEMTWVQLHDQCSQRCFRKKESKAVSKTPLAVMHYAEAGRNLKEVAQEDGKRERAPRGG